MNQARPRCTYKGEKQKWIKENQGATSNHKGQYFKFEARTHLSL